MIVSTKSKDYVHISLYYPYRAKLQIKKNIAIRSNDYNNFIIDVQELAYIKTLAREFRKTEHGF